MENFQCEILLAAVWSLYCMSFLTRIQRFSLSFYFWWSWMLLYVYHLALFYSLSYIGLDFLPWPFLNQQWLHLLYFVSLGTCMFSELMNLQKKIVLDSTSSFICILSYSPCNQPYWQHRTKSCLSSVVSELISHSLASQKMIILPSYDLINGFKVFQDFLKWTICFLCVSLI